MPAHNPEKILGMDRKTNIHALRLASPGVDEEALRQELGEVINTPVADPADHSGKRRSLIPLAMLIVILSLIGFTASNWMMRQQVSELAERVKQAEARPDMTASGMQAGHRESGAAAVQQAESEYQILALEIKQLKAHAQETRKSIAALEHSVDGLKRSAAVQAELRMLEKRKAGSGLVSRTGQRVRQAKEVKAGSGLVPHADQRVKQAVRKTRPAPAFTKRRTVKGRVTEVPAPSERGRGVWVVNLIALSSEISANRELAKLKKAGIAAEKREIKARGRVMYQLRAGRFGGAAEGRAFIRDVAIRAGYKDAWLGSVK